MTHVRKIRLGPLRCFWSPWLGTKWYDIQAKAPNADAGKAEMSLMLQSLLADRFKLQLRRDTVAIPVFALVIDKGDKGGFRLRSLKEGEQSHCSRDNSFVCGLRTTSDLAKSLQYIVKRPALAGQLGLKLAAQQATLPRLVVESIQRPTEN